MTNTELCPACHHKINQAERIFIKEGKAHHFACAANPTLISVTDLSQLTGYSVAHIAQLIKRKQLPSGEKRGKYRMLPLSESLFILETHTPRNWHDKKFSKKKLTKESKRKSSTFDLFKHVI